MPKQTIAAYHILVATTLAEDAQRWRQEGEASIEAADSYGLAWLQAACDHFGFEEIATRMPRFRV